MHPVAIHLLAFEAWAPTGTQGTVTRGELPAPERSSLRRSKSPAEDHQLPRHRPEPARASHSRFQIRGWWRCPRRPARQGCWHPACQVDGSRGTAAALAGRPTLPAGQQSAQLVVWGVHEQPRGSPRILAAQGGRERVSSRVRWATVWRSCALDASTRTVSM